MFVLWLTGISGAGKTTLGKAVCEEIKKIGETPEFLDGDEVREFFGADLGYSKEDRISNNKRFIFGAMLLERNNIVTVVANIAPYADIREFARAKLKNYIQVYVKASQEECIKRDVKGHYQKVRSGEMKNFVGKDQEYEVPESPDLIVDTENLSIEQSVEQIMKFLKEKNYLCNQYQY